MSFDDKHNRINDMHSIHTFRQLRSNSIATLI